MDYTMSNDARSAAPATAVGSQSMTSPMQQQNDAQLPSRTSSAPLPSPTQQRPQYFSSLSGSTVSSSSTSSAQTSPHNSAHFQHAQFQPNQYQPAQSNGQNGYGSEYVPDRTGAGQTAQETTGFISQFGLVAEAAKRAQMAVLMRDMEGMEMT